MHAVLYRPISVDAPTWAGNKITDIFKIISYSYTKKFYEVGSFSMVIPVNEPSAELLEVNTFLATNDGDYLFVTKIRETESRIILEGYDLKYLLAGRITLFPTDEQDTGTYGYYVTKGSTGECICNIVRHNITEASDPNRKIYGFSVSNMAQGLAEDTYMTRLEPLDQVVAALCKNAGIGYDVTMEIGSSLGDGIRFTVIQPTDRSEKQTDVPKVIFSKSFLNVESLSREVGVDAEKNAIYAINGTNIDDAAVKLVNRNGEGNADYGIYRRETTVNVNCDVDEIDGYALREAEDLVSADSFTVEAAAAESYKKDWFVGDIVTFRHKDIVRHVPIIAAEIQRTAEKFTVKLSAGKSPLKPVSAISRTADKAADEITQKKFDEGYVLVVKELPDEGGKNKIYVLEAENSETALLADNMEAEAVPEAVNGYVFVEGKWKRLGEARSGETSDNAEKIKFVKDNIEYGAVGIHEVNGETGIALSITKASNGLALIDENAEKILEYVPNQKSLQFYPTNQEGTEGLYFSDSELNYERFMPSESTEDMDKYIATNMTWLCKDSSTAAQLKEAGFTNVLNASTIKNETWVFNGLVYTADYYEFKTDNNYYPGGGFWGVYLNAQPNQDYPWRFSAPFAVGEAYQYQTVFNTEFGYAVRVEPIAVAFPVFKPIYTTNGVLDYYSITMFQLIPWKIDGITYFQVYPKTLYIDPNGYEPFDCTGLSSRKIEPTNAQFEIIKNIVEKQSTKNTIRVYKDIVLMNGVKILNEGGSEYSIESEVTP